MPRYRIRGEIIEAPSQDEAIKLFEMGGVERFARGAAAGAENFGRNLTAMALPESMEPSWAKPEAIRAGRMNPVLNTKAGQFGDMVGGVAASLPVGGAVGKLVGTGAKAIGSAWAARNAPGLAATTAGAVEGAASAGPDSRGIGAALGAPLGYAAARFMPGTSSFITNPIKATPEAQRLMGMGIDLTPQQMNPNHWIGSLEEIISKVPGVANARDAAKEQWVRRLLRDAAPPGSDIAKMGAKEIDQIPIENLAANAYDAFGPAYRKFYDTEIDDAAVVGLGGRMQAISQTPSMMADDVSRKEADKFLANVLTLLRKDAPPDFEQLQAVRSAIRKEMRDSPLDSPARRLLSMANQEMTDVMTKSMDPADAAKLAAVDQKYADTMLLADALNRGGAKAGGFTPSQAAAELKKREGKSFGRGGSGDVLSQDIRAALRAFEEKTPVTGARLLVPMIAGGAMGKAALIPGAGVALAAGTRTGRKLMAGNTKAQYYLAKKLAQTPTQGPMAAGIIGSTAAAGGNEAGIY